MADDTALPPPPSLPKPKRKRGRKSGTEAVRMQEAIYGAFTIYISNPGMSIQAVWETGAVSTADGAPLIRDCIGLEYLHVVAGEQSWVARRDRHWQEVRARVEAKLLDEHVQRTLQDIKGLEALKVVALQHVRGDSVAGIKPVLPKTLEGVMNAYANVTKVEVELRRTVVQQAADAARARPDPHLDPQLPGAGNAGALVLEDDGFSDHDIEAMARAAALNASLGGPKALLPAPPLPAESDNAKAKSDNETLARPVMEPL